MVGKLLVSAFQNFWQIENQLNIKKVMSKDVCVCSFPIFDIFDIHCITAQILCNLKYVEDVEDYLRHLQHALIYTVFDGMVGKLLVSAFQNFS